MKIERKNEIDIDINLFFVIYRELLFFPISERISRNGKYMKYIVVKYQEK